MKSLHLQQVIGGAMEVLSFALDDVGIHACMPDALNENNRHGRTVLMMVSLTADMIFRING